MSLAFQTEWRARSLIVILSIGLLPVARADEQGSKIKSPRGKVSRIAKKRVLGQWDSDELQVGAQLLIANEDGDGVDAQIEVSKVRKGKTPLEFMAKITLNPAAIPIKTFKSRIVLSPTEVAANPEKFSNGAIRFIQTASSGESSGPANQIVSDGEPSFRNPLISAQAGLMRKEVRLVNLLVGTDLNVNFNQFLGGIHFFVPSIGFSNAFGLFYETEPKTSGKLNFKTAADRVVRTATATASSSRAGIIFRIPFGQNRLGLEISALNQSEIKLSYDNVPGTDSSVDQTDTLTAKGLGVLMSYEVLLVRTLMIQGRIGLPLAQKLELSTTSSTETIDGSLTSLTASLGIGPYYGPQKGSAGATLEVLATFQYENSKVSGLDEISSYQIQNDNALNLGLQIQLGYIFK